MSIFKIGAAATLRQNISREISTREKRASHQPLTRFTTQQTSKQTEERMMCHIAFIVSFFAHHCFHRKKKYRKEKKCHFRSFFQFYGNHTDRSYEIYSSFGSATAFMRDGTGGGGKEKRSLSPGNYLGNEGRWSVFLDGGRGRRRRHHTIYASSDHQPPARG